MKPAVLRTLRWLLLIDLIVVVAAQLAKRLIPEVGDEHSDVFQVVTVMDGRRWTSNAPALRSGSVITAMAGTELDLRRALLDPNGARLRLTTVMGGVEVRVPSGWRVRVEATAWLGVNDLKRLAVDVPEDAPVLEIRGTTVMGGVTIFPVPNVVV